MLTLTDLLAIEEDLQVLDFKFEHDEFLMWPLIRANLLLEALYAEYGLSDAHARSEKLSLQGTAAYLLTTARENPFRSAGPRSIVMFSSGISNVKRGETYFNRLHDYFAMELRGSTILIEDSVRKRYRRPRQFQPVRSHDWIHIQGVLRARATRLSSRDHATARSMILYLKNNFPHTFDSAYWENVQATLANRGRRLKVLHECYDRLFDRLEPRVVFVEDGSYGARSYIFKWARARKIVAAELQHGLISRNHPAYNYAPAVVHSPQYREYLPEFLLTYGRYWSDQVRTSSKAIVIGDPYLSEYLQRGGPDGRKNTKTVILIVSGGGVPEIMAGITLDLSRLLPFSQYEVVFRPHPGEVPLVKDRYSRFDSTGIRMDLSTDIYESLSRCDAVAGEMSTVLFEATAFSKPVFALDNDYGRLQFPDNLFPRFKTAEELVNLLHSVPEGNSFDARSLWEHNWRERYHDFIRSVTGEQSSPPDLLLANSIWSGAA